LPKGQARRRFWTSFFEGRVADAALAGMAQEARRLAGRLLTSSDGSEKGFVWIVGAGPGDPDLLTLRAQRVLQEAEVIVHDGAVPDAVIAMGRRDARRIRAEDGAAGDLMVREAAAGRRTVRLMFGDPLASGRAAEAIAALRHEKFPFEVVPGIAPAPVAEGYLPLTLQGTASNLLQETAGEQSAARARARAA
jgi:uroporphyrin-III C-methyltransferase/precorrin-2 dehydrogenase/sirohydrochlorin ferrochelatase